MVRCRLCDRVTKAPGKSTMKSRLCRACVYTMARLFAMSY